MKVNKQTFTLVFEKEFQQVNYIAGFDPSVSQSFGAIIKTKPKKGHGIKKIKGYNRVVNIGWSYIIERV